jgi:hypothetical protein
MFFSTQFEYALHKIIKLWLQFKCKRCLTISCEFRTILSEFKKFCKLIFKLVFQSRYKTCFIIEAKINLDQLLKMDGMNLVAIGCDWSIFQQSMTYTTIWLYIKSHVSNFVSLYYVYHGLQHGAAFADIFISLLEVKVMSLPSVQCKGWVPLTRAEFF